MSTVAIPESILQRIRGEFHESPGLRLTEREFQRLWNLDAEEASMTIERLMVTRFLRRTMDGTLVRCETLR